MVRGLIDSSNSTLRAFLIDLITALFSLRSSTLRLQAEMLCTQADQVRETSKFRGFFETVLDSYEFSFRRRLRIKILAQGQGGFIVQLGGSL